MDTKAIDLNADYADDTDLIEAIDLNRLEQRSHAPYFFARFS
jgi:hypothetical protein